MTGITMFDTAYNDQFPPGGQAYAAYVDGGIGDQPNYGYIVRTFPGAYHLSISVTGADADCLDIEARAASPQEAADWYRRQKARGIARPCLYANASTMQANVIPVILAAQIPRTEVRLWSAHYGAGEHICAPSTCGLVSMPMDGTQWTSTALGRTLDQSDLEADFFGTPAPGSPQWTEFDMSKLRVLKQGDADKAGSGFWSVHRLQALLKLSGQLAGIPSAAALTVDGALGPKTATAIRDLEQHYRQRFPQMIVDAPGQEAAGAQVWGVLLTGSPA